MLDINFIRDNKKLTQEAFQKRKVTLSVDDLLKMDDKRRQLIQKVDQLRARKNKLSKTRDNSRIKEAQDIKKKLINSERELKGIQEKFQNIMLSLPNFPDPEVPEGESEKDNKIIKKWGKPRNFSFQPKDHLSLGEQLGIIDLKRGAKVSGNSFYYLKNEAALLEMAVIRFAIDKVRKAGFDFFITPDLVKEEAMIGTGFFPTEENEIYHVAKDHLYLTGTAEVPLASYRSGEIIDKANLPLHYAGFSACFRREAGSYGKETKGLFRVHQFNKVEMFTICIPDEAEKEHHKLLKISEDILQELQLPYQVVINCLGDLGYPNKKRYDLNTWMPSWKGFRETHSASNDGDFQARRLNIRYRDQANQTHYCYTLNNTAIASPRILIAILENHQTDKGGVKIPKCLYPYLNFKEIKPKNS
jgi:seryl-tRNA synthetase